TVNFFYTGVASWEFLTSNDHGVGRVPVVKKKKTCRECHISKDGTFDIQVPEITKGSLTMNASRKSFEPNPIPNKPAMIDAMFQVTYDSDYVYVRMQWNSAGKSWNSADDDKNDKPDRVAIQMNLGQEEFSKFGCFIACHNDQNTMPDSPSKDKVAKHPYYAKLKRDDVHLYAFYTRNNGWEDIKDDTSLADLLEKDGLIDLWVVGIKGKNMEVKDEFVFADRRDDSKNDIEASGTWENGKYTVIMKRKLVTLDQEDIQLKAGSSFNIGLAIHDDGAQKRQHYVSFPVSIGLGTKGTITATKIR
ncbi:MAG: ethylbenzene dehydrogenase-related protein, partial [Deltaproteobacteria bacterium]